MKQPKSNTFVLPQNIVPIPRADLEKEKKKRQKKRKSTQSGAVLLTISPYRKELSKDDEIKEFKESLKRLKSQLREQKAKVPVRNTTQHTIQLKRKVPMEPKKKMLAKTLFKNTEVVGTEIAGPSGVGENQMAVPNKTI